MAPVYGLPLEMIASEIDIRPKATEARLPVWRYLMALYYGCNGDGDRDDSGGARHS
jgi:hypothetical protein